MVEGKGIYVGPWTPPVLPYKIGPQWGSRVVFDLFAARRICPPTTREISKDAAAEITKTDLLGHPGIFFDNEHQLNAALQTGNYNGQWFVPTIEQLIGVRPDGTQGGLGSKRLFLRQPVRSEKQGSFPGTFVCAGNYWSITENPHSGRQMVHPALAHREFERRQSRRPRCRGCRGENIRLVRLEPRLG